MLPLKRMDAHNFMHDERAGQNHGRAVCRAEQRAQNRHHALLCADEEQIADIDDLPHQRQEKADEHQFQIAFVFYFSELHVHCAATPTR